MKSFRYLCLLSIISTVMMTGCEATWNTFTSQDCAYEFQYPDDARVETMDRGASQIKVYAGTEEPFQVTCARDYAPGDALYYLDTRAAGEQKIGEIRWTEFRLPEGYCDAAACSPPLYALQMESGGVLYTVTFYSQETITEPQKEILSTFRIS